MKRALVEDKRIQAEMNKASRRTKRILSLKSHGAPKTYKTVPGTRIRLDDAEIDPPDLPEQEGVTSWSLAFVSLAFWQASIDLKTAGYAVWAPMVTKWVTHSRMRKRTHTPLFPGYLFVGRKKGPTRAIGDIMGVQYIVSNTANERDLSPRVMKVFKQLVDAQAAGEFDEASRTDPYTLLPIKRDPVTQEILVGFKPGATVQANSGPFEGIFGQVVRMTPGNRVAVLLRVITEQGVSEKPVEFPVGMVQEVAA